MAYPAYDAYNPPLAYPRSVSFGQQYGAPHEYAYSDPMVTGAYGDVYQQPAYPIYTPSASQYHASRSRDDLDYYGDRQMSGYGTPYLGRSRSHRRRSSSMSYHRAASMDGRHRTGSTLLKFKRKGGFRTGITLGEAMSNVRLSGNDSYYFQDLNVDHRGRMILKIRWTGYSSMTYELPVDGYDGRVDLQTLARRVARACVHFLQANVIPISWDRVILYHLEEVTYGTWQPILSTS